MPAKVRVGKGRINSFGKEWESINSLTGVKYMLACCLIFPSSLYCFDQKLATCTSALEMNT
jgi:hypothetical protein